MYQVLSITANDKSFIFDVIKEAPTYEEALAYSNTWKELGLEHEPFINHVED